MSAFYNFAWLCITRQPCVVMYMRQSRDKPTPSIAFSHYFLCCAKLRMADMNNCSTAQRLITSICMYIKTARVRRWIRWWWLFEQRLWKTSPCISTLLSWEMASLHHHLAKMEMSHLLTRSILTHLEVSILVFPSFFCLMFCSISVLSVIYYGAFCWYFATNFLCKPVFCPKLGLYLLMCNLTLHMGMKKFSSQPSTSIPKGDVCRFCSFHWTIIPYIRTETISRTWGTAFDHVWPQRFAITDTFSSLTPQTPERGDKERSDHEGSHIDLLDP
jgi:hypothetical protein